MPERGQSVCPECGTGLASDAVLCLGCGYHLGKRERLQTQRQPFRRSWDVGLTLPAQAAVAGALLVACAACVAIQGPRWWWSFPFALLVVANLSWTGRRIVVERTPQGHLQLTAHGWLFFVPVVHARVDLRQYDSVYTSYVGSSGYTADEPGDWFWLEVRGPRAKPVRIYRGQNEQTMKEIVNCLQGAGLTVRRGSDE
jgi:hypothetical protein